MTAAGAGLDHDAIAARIPHAGPMCLLDQAVSWDESRIECTAFARPPRHPDAAARSGPEASVAAHPLAQDGRLPATAAIEYAAQAELQKAFLFQRLYQAVGAGLGDIQFFRQGTRRQRLCGTGHGFDDFQHTGDGRAFFTRGTAHGEARCGR